jgi:hypothetical protein
MIGKAKIVTVEVGKKYLTGKKMKCMIYFDRG